LDQLEADLKIKLPEVYREFLKICNGGELFAIPAGTILSEVYDPSKGEKKQGSRT
jgi:cell wall assembly regulator SMI1